MQRKIFWNHFYPKRYHKPQEVTGYSENSETIHSSADSIGNHKLSYKQVYTLPHGLHTSYVKLAADYLKAWLIIEADTIMNLTYLINKSEWRNSGVKCDSTITENKIFNELFHHSMGKAKFFVARQFVFRYTTKRLQWIIRILQSPSDRF